MPRAGAQFEKMASWLRHSEHGQECADLRLGHHVEGQRLCLSHDVGDGHGLARDHRVVHGSIRPANVCVQRLPKAVRWNTGLGRSSVEAANDKSALAGRHFSRLRRAPFVDAAVGHQGQIELAVLQHVGPHMWQVAQHTLVLRSGRANRARRSEQTELQRTG